jgi:hypothetical protein
MARDFIGMTLEASFDQSGRPKKRPTMRRSARAKLTGPGGKAFKLKVLRLLITLQEFAAGEATKWPTLPTVLKDARTAIRAVRNEVFKVLYEGV